MTGIDSFAARAAAFTLLIACTSAPAAASPGSIRKMDSTAIQAVPEIKLCKAYAHYQGLRKFAPVIEAEVRRRQLSCAEQLEYTVSDCSVLRVLAVEPGPYAGSTVFTIANSTPRLKAFRIYYQGIQSSIFSLQPGETRAFGVQSDPRLATFASGAAAARGDTQVELNECVTSRYAF